MPSDATCAQVLAGPSGYAPPTTIATMAPGFELHLVNAAGPTIDVLINGVNVGRLTCSGGGADLVVRPGGNRPSLPWTVEFITTGGTSLGSAVLDGSEGSMIITVAGQSFVVAQWPLDAPATPAASCPA
jgi:hypothetical protein